MTSSSTKVTGKAEAYSTVYVKAGTKVIGSAKAAKSGSFSVKIAKQKTGKILYVYAKDKAGNTGKSAKITVKKR
ncbi:Ig-like domain-containing protein [Cytobacillus pseudoceanisediminis]|uniref:Ig-like domain-containing protein n=1 Tax=Cytobacillus pseudoceanisediminis TaxID=3051614 RepID=UPI0034E1B1C1